MYPTLIVALFFALFLIFTEKVGPYLIDNGVGQTGTWGIGFCFGAAWILILWAVAA